MGEDHQEGGTPAKQEFPTEQELELKMMREREEALGLLESSGRENTNQTRDSMSTWRTF